MGLVNSGFVLLSKYRALLPYIIAQARHETNDYTSAVYITNHNMFGMKNGSVISEWEKIGTMSPEGNTYAAYDSDLGSLRDLLQWFEWKGFPVSVASDSEYSKALTDRGFIGLNPSALAVKQYADAIKFWLGKIS